MERSHFTESMPYQPGITARKGKPWFVGSFSPFMLNATSESGCIAFSIGMIRARNRQPRQPDEVRRALDVAVRSAMQGELRSIPHG